MIKLKIKYGNSQTALRFPCTEKEMNAELERIHAEDVTPLELYVSEVVFPEELDFLQDRFANLDEVNYLAKRMDSFFGNEEYQFYEAMKLEGFIEGATSYAEVGRFFTETEDRYILDLEMEDYFDYEGFGEYISDKFYGKFVCGGFIYNDTDTSLLDILYQDEPMTMGGM